MNFGGILKKRSKMMNVDGRMMKFTPGKDGALEAVTPRKIEKMNFNPVQKKAKVIMPKRKSISTTLISSVRG